MNKRKLNSVTLLGVDCLDIDRLILAADICQEKFSFGAVKLLTSLPSTHPAVIPIDHLGSVEKYSEFVMTSLDQHVETEHVLIIQYDGFILNPDAWTDEFLQYDYIGSPWLVKDWLIKFGFPPELMGKLVVGNGGFSLRSKKFTSLITKLYRSAQITEAHPEDTVLCVRNRALMEKNGMKFAPVALAKKFGLEGEDDEHTAWNGQFGFHGIRWTDISGWIAKHPEYAVDQKANTFSRRPA